jgi:hypothetical protein
VFPLGTLEPLTTGVGGGGLGCCLFPSSRNTVGGAGLAEPDDSTDVGMDPGLEVITGVPHECLGTPGRLVRPPEPLP